MSAWSEMNVNKIVTYSDLALAISSGDLFQKQAFSSSAKGIKKSDVATFIHIDESNPEYVSRTSSQVLPRKAIIGKPPFFNLFLTSSASPSTVTAGNNVVYTVNVRNDETYTTSSAIALTITFPANVSFTGYTITAGVSSTFINNVLTITSGIAAGATVVITITCSTTRPLTDGAGIQAIDLTARYTPTNATTATAFLQFPTFTLEKVARQNDGTTNIPAGTNIPFNTTFIYLLRVRNTTSNLYSSNTVLTDVLPANLTFDSFVTPLPLGWTSNYNSGTRTVTFNKSDVLHDSIFNTFISLGIRVIASTQNVSISNTFTASGTGINSKESASFDLSVGLNTSPILTSQNYLTCSSCQTFTVFRDTNPNSATFNSYFVGGDNVGLNAPSNGACDYSSQYENTFQIVCISCNSFFVFAHNYNVKPCYAGAPFQVNGVDYYSNPATGACNTSSDYSSYVGVLCINCIEYSVFQNTNPCFTGNQFISNNVTYSSNPSTGACSSSANYAMYVGQTCVNCETLSVFQNVQACFTGNQFQAGGVTYANNPTTQACNTTPNIVNQGYNTCSSCVNYTVFRDTNVCSLTYNRYFVNGVDVGFSAPQSGSCNYSQELEFQGYNTCVSCVSYSVFRDVSVCSSTYNSYFVNGSNIGTSAPSSAPCNCCEEINVFNYLGYEVYLEWLSCTNVNTTSYYLQVGESITFCRNTGASINTGDLAYSVLGSCNYNGYSNQIT